MNAQKIAVMLCGLIFLLAATVQAAPLLLAAAEDAKAGAEPGYTLNTEVAAQLWQGGVFSLTLPVNGREVEFQQTERLVRTENLTWRGTDASGQLTALLTLGQNHVYGQIFGADGTVAIVPEAHLVRLKRLDPAKEAALEQDTLAPPAPEEDGRPDRAAEGAEDGSRIDVMVLVHQRLGSGISRQPDQYTHSKSA